MHAFAAAPTAQLEAADVQLCAGLDVAQVADRPLAVARLVVDDLDGLAAREHDSLDVKLTHRPDVSGAAAHFLRGKIRERIRSY
jgi:hypothetical protein